MSSVLCPPKQKLVICVPLWGSTYIKQWIDWSWPSLSSPENIQATSETFEVIVQIITQPSSYNEISDGIKDSSLAHCVDIQILPLLDPVHHDKYSSMTSAVLISMKYAVQQGALFIFSGADLIWADGGVRYLSQQLLSFSSVFACGVTLDQEGATKALQKFRNDNVLKIKSRDLAEVALKNFHALTKSFEITSVLVPQNLWCAIWVSSDARSAVIRAHAPTPIGINFSTIEKARIKKYIDKLSRFVLDSSETFEPLVEDFSKTLVVSDSDDFLCVSLDTADRLPVPALQVSCLPSERDNLFLIQLTRYQRLQTNISRFLFTKTFVLHAKDLDGWVSDQIQTTHNQICLQMAQRTKVGVTPILWRAIPSLSWQVRISKNSIAISLVRFVRCSSSIISRLARKKRLK